MDRSRLPLALRLLAALVLFAGLVLGAIDLIHNGVYAAHGLLGGGAALVLGVAGLLGLVLTRLGAGAARAVALLFAVYAGFNAAAWTAAEDSCGCFGALSIPPAAAFALDAVLAIALLASAWPATAAARSVVAAVALLALGLGAGTWQSGLFAPAPPPVLPPAPPDLAGPVDAAGSEAQFVSSPEEHAAPSPRPSPSGPAGLDQGDWTLVLLRSDCADCQRFLNQQGPLLDTAMIAPGSTLLVVDLAASGGSGLDHRLPPALQRAQRQHPDVIEAARQRFRHHHVPSAVRLQSGLAFDEDLALRFGWR